MNELYVVGGIGRDTDGTRSHPPRDVDMNKVVMRWPATSDDLDYVTRISVTVRQPCHSSIY